jgi:hypothetical protein
MKKALPIQPRGSGLNWPGKNKISAMKENIPAEADLCARDESFQRRAETWAAVGSELFETNIDQELSLANKIQLRMKLLDLVKDTEPNAAFLKEAVAMYTKLEELPIHKKREASESTEASFFNEARGILAGKGSI